MQEIPKQFNFQEDEEKIYKLWEESGFFSPDKIDSEEKYCNVLPPPNANGELHLGHASGYTVMDIFGRYERMKGKKVLLLPGKDHAGIQTQVVFEKKLKEEKNISRHELGREEFYKQSYEFTTKSADYMRSQEKRIGISADWSREKFTLDPDVLKTALETFVKMYEDGMIYKGRRIINWCSRCATALSDVEVVHQEAEGKLYYIKYPIKGSEKFITVATTRPETMLGDTAVAVNPKDKKYEKLVGKSVILPLQDRKIPIIADYRIEMEFGTGAVKITPAHDPLDWEIGKEHNLEEIQVIDEKAEITAAGGKYEGLKVLEARDQILKDLAELGLLEKEEENKINKSICERCKTIIEPLISQQWFANVDAEKYSLKKEALKAIKDGQIEIFPKNFKKIMIHWYENLNDWCISRQIWWGPQFPVWYKGEEIYVGLEKPDSESPDSAKASTGEWIQDENTFDTWFTSGQWPYTTLRFPEGEDANKFYPTDMMVMGRDILPFWAARMIMFGLYKTGQAPFKNLYFTGLVRDKEGYKFSKSRGNGIDPLEMIEKYGADALRLSLVMDIAPGQDSRLYEEKIESFRNFVTKLWNIFRYCTSVENFELVEKLEKEDLKSLSDRWIVSELEEAKKAISDLLKNRDISLAQSRLRRFTWDQFADWYVEINKIEKNTKVLGYVLDNLIKMWHPFTPFVTEKMWNILKGEKNLLMVEKWPEADGQLIDKNSQKEFVGLQEIMAKIRNIRSNYHISPLEIIDAYGEERGENEIIGRLGRIKISSVRAVGKMLPISGQGITLWLDIAKMIDVKKELGMTNKEIKNFENLIAKTEALINNEKFRSKASAEIINSTNARLDGYRQKLEIQKDLEKNLKSLL
ncbi:MAG TPA: valine--tRNA ligase [Candidatus Moranbacteria bacterium]|nr:valine--tRNA ligase [Candidatus Moranbacteria bacterium]